jgi:hypothetical protein
MGIVVDAYITLSWCFPDEQAPLSLRVLDRLNAGEEALVPAFWSVEVLNSLLVGEKRDGFRRNKRGLFSAIWRFFSQPLITHHWNKCLARSKCFAVGMG